MNERRLTGFIQVEVILIAELLGATGKEYIIVPKEVLEAGNLENMEMFPSVTVQNKSVMFGNNTSKYPTRRYIKK